MLFKPETLGELVRPRILAKGTVVLKKDLPEYAFTATTLPSKSNYSLIFGQNLDKLFSKLLLGDTSKDLSTSYTGEIVCYVVRIASTMTLVDKHNVQETLKKARKKLGARANLRVVSVGLQFHQGLTRDEHTGLLQPLHSCPLKTPDGQETVWFFNPWELVPMKEILKYESVHPGDLVLFKKAKGMVVKKKKLNKPRFYSTSSWSCYSITLLNHTADGYSRFLPERFFMVRRSEDETA